MAELTEKDEIREAVRERYAAAATSVGRGTRRLLRTVHGADAAKARDVLRLRHGRPDACGGETFGAGLYEIGDQDSLPDTAKLASLGCGNPTAVAELHEGESVLDLGSGGGIDVLLSARRVGPTGKAYGARHDRRDARARAREPARGRGRERRVPEGNDRGRCPLPDDSVDVIISNCVINLSGDKPAVFREAARVLRPGGRFAVTDIVADPDMDEATRARHGAVDRLHRRRAHRGGVPRASSRQPASRTIEIRETHRVHDQAGSAIIRATRLAA